LGSLGIVATRASQLCKEPDVLRFEHVGGPSVGLDERASALFGVPDGIVPEGNDGFDPTLDFCLVA
jgi:hypothetical protein